MADITANCNGQLACCTYSLCSDTCTVQLCASHTAAAAAATARAQREKDEKTAQQARWFAMQESPPVYSRPRCAISPEALTAVRYAAMSATIKDLEEQQQLQAATLREVTSPGVTADSDVTAVLVPPAPEFYGMHALNTLYSDLEPVAVRSNNVVAV
jgi:hypothetical protein